MDENKNWNQIAKYLSGEMTSDEQDAFMDWLSKDDTHQVQFEEALLLWETTSNTPEVKEWDTQAAWEQVDKQLDTHETPVIPISKSIAWSKQLLRIAAIFLVGIIGYWSFQNRLPQAELLTFKTNSTEQKELVLPDSSRVWLNVNSTLSYYDVFTTR